MDNNFNYDSSVSKSRPVMTSGNGLDTSSGMHRESWREAIDHLGQDVSLLWEKQSRLMQKEMEEKIDLMKVAAGAVASSGAFLLVGVFCLATTLIFALSLVIPSWAAAAIVTVTFFLIGGILLGTAKKKMTASELKPKKSIETFGLMSHTLKERYNEFKHH